MSQSCEALVTKAELKKELAPYPTEQAVTGIVALGLLETSKQIAKKVDATELGKRIIDVERKIADPIAKANAAAKAAEEARRKAISAAEIAGQAADATRSQGSKLGSALSRIISIATTLGTIYALLENMVDRERFAALENSFNLFQQVYDAQTASIQRILRELNTKIQNAEILAEDAQNRSFRAIQTAEASIKQVASIDFDTNLRLNKMNARLDVELSKLKNFNAEFGQLKQELQNKASKADLKALEERINSVNSATTAKNYDPAIERLENSVKAANDRINKADKTIQEQSAKIAGLNVQVRDLETELTLYRPRIINSPKVIDWNVATYDWWDPAKQAWIPVPIGQTPWGTPQTPGATGYFASSPNSNTGGTVGGGGGGAGSQLQTQTDNLTKGLTSTQTKIAELEKGLSALGTKVNTPPVPRSTPVPTPTPVPAPTPTPVPNYQPQIDALTAALAALKIQVGEIPLVNMPQINSRFNGIENGIVGIRNDLNNRVTPSVRRIENNTSPSNIANATAAGVCQEAGGNGCLGGRLNNLDRTMGNTGDTLRNLASLMFDGFNAVANTSQLNQLGNVQRQLSRIEAQNVETHTRLGERIVGGISGWARRLNQQFGLSRWLELIQTAVLLHNAMMLSNSILTSLGYVIDNVLNIAGFQFQDAEGDNISFTGLVNSTIEEFIRNIIGDTTYEEIRSTWLVWNRVIQTASNLYHNVRNIFDTTREMFETVTENTGKVGNALKRFLVVPENAYPWMSERVTATNRITKGIDKYVQGAAATREVFDSISEVTEGVIEIQETAEEIKESREEAKKAIEDFRKETDDRETQINQDSKPPEINFKDLFKKEPE